MVTLGMVYDCFTNINKEIWINMVVYYTYVYIYMTITILSNPIVGCYTCIITCIILGGSSHES